MYWLDAYRHRRKVTAILQAQEDFSQEFREKIKAAEKAKDRDTYDGLVSEMFFETDLSDNEVARLETTFLTREARRYMIPVPPLKESDAWEESSVDARHYLTFAAMRDLRNRIREERRLRAEPVTIWLPLAIGLIGAVTGLVSVLRP
jgi:hypothetical protein